MTFHIDTLGCKVNIYESEMIRQKFLKENYQEVEKNADIYIINTCSVTNVADSKSRKLVRRNKKNNPHSIIVVCGCSAQNNNKIFSLMDVDIIIGNNQKSQIVDFVKKFRKDQKKYNMINKNKDWLFEDMQVNEFKKHTRAFVKIQDGCDNFCTYCIIPYVRGNIRSKKMETVIEEVKNLVDHEYQEIILTGIHTGSYGRDLGYTLTELIQQLSLIDKLKRIRISSIEITELDNEFIHELAINPKICDHLHIPLQAGTNEILKRMNRKYDLSYYQEKLKKIRLIRPGINISTDVIVGFPYETKELFEQSLSFIKEMNFSKIHVFSYSKRQSTPASIMPYQVEENEKKRRNTILSELSKHLEHVYAKSYLHSKVEVLIEEVFEDYSIGHTSNYLKIKINQRLKKNQFYVFTIHEIKENMLFSNTKTLCK